SHLFPRADPSRALLRLFSIVEHRLEIVLVGTLLLAGSTLAFAGGGSTSTLPPLELAPTHAVGIETDTMFVGGYARGSFAEAMQLLAPSITRDERQLVGKHLDRIFAGILDADGLGATGRLRVAFERSLRPDGTVR